MHVVVDLPDPATGLDQALAKQFAEIQRQLMGLVKDQSDAKSSMHAMMMKLMASHQEALVQAMERLVGMVQTSVNATAPSDALVIAVRGLKQTVADLPGELQTALEKHYRAAQEHSMTVSVKPRVTVAMPQGFTNRLDSLENAVVNGLRRSRNRTFGSNY